MVIVTYILMNLSRIFFMRGVVRVFWRFLTDGRFSYIGSCKRDGEIVYSSKITHEGYSMRRAIRESLAKRILYWERKALMIVLFALSLNVPYIAVLVYLNENFSMADGVNAGVICEDCR